MSCDCGRKCGDPKYSEWFPVIDYSKCVGCLACMKKCKQNVFEEKEGKPFVINPNNCVPGCRGCEGVCPMEAITHQGKEI